MLERWREISEVFREISASQGFVLAAVAFAGGIAHLVVRSLRGTSAASIWHIIGSLFVATVVGILVGMVAKSYVEKHPELVTVFAFMGGYLWKKILDKIEKLDFQQFIRFIRGRDGK